MAAYRNQLALKLARIREQAALSLGVENRISVDPDFEMQSIEDYRDLIKRDVDLDDECMLKDERS